MERSRTNYCGLAIWLILLVIRVERVLALYFLGYQIYGQLKLRYAPFGTPEYFNVFLRLLLQGSN